MRALIGLMGGTFDPVHNGHLAVATGLCRGLHMDCVRLILNAVPPHRTVPACSVEHRLAMLESAAASDQCLAADTRELDRPGPSYSVWTLRSLRRDYPDDALCWVVGADAWLDLRKWHRWEELSSLAHIVVVKRPGWTIPPGAEAGLSRGRDVLIRRAAGAAVLFDGPEVDVSASGIRERIAAGADVSALLPEPVLRYISSHGLYGCQQSNS